jgi:hypothetical protein
MRFRDIRYNISLRANSGSRTSRTTILLHGLDVASFSMGTYRTPDILLPPPKLSRMLRVIMMEQSSDDLRGLAKLGSCQRCMIASLRFLGLSLLILSLGGIFGVQLVIVIGTLAVVALGSLVSLHVIFYLLKRKKIITVHPLQPPQQQPQQQPQRRRGCCGSR